MKFDSNLMKLLMEVGFLATNNTGQPEAASTIFKGVAKARPQSAYPQIGLGCAAIVQRNFSEAVEILRSAPASERSERELCNGFLGLALKLGGYREESSSVLAQLQQEGENEVAVRMASSLLEELQ